MLYCQENLTINCYHSPPTKNGNNNFVVGESKYNNAEDLLSVPM